MRQWLSATPHLLHFLPAARSVRSCPSRSSAQLGNPVTKVTASGLAAYRDRHREVWPPNHQPSSRNSYHFPSNPTAMTNRGSFVPEFSRPVTVAYIDHHLQEQHPMFLNPPVRYDRMSGQYAPNNEVPVPPPDGDSLPPRPDWTNINAMGFWNGIFPDAMTEFKKTKEPRGRSSTEYSIRSPDSWDEIYRRLEAAQAKYQQEAGPGGWLRKVRRKVADNITPVAGAAGIAAKVAHGEPIATPVLDAVRLVLDVSLARAGGSRQPRLARIPALPYLANQGGVPGCEDCRVCTPTGPRRL